MSERLDLKAILAAVRGAEAGSEKLDREIARALDDPWSPDEDGHFGGYDLMPRRVHYTRSIDAAASLIRRKLAGWSWECSSGSSTARSGNLSHAAWAIVSTLTRSHGAHAPSAAMALVEALLLALTK